MNNSSRFSNSGNSFRIPQPQGTSVDWKGLQVKFQELKSYLSEPSLSFSNSSTQRSKQRENVKLGLEAIIEVASSESHMLLRDGEYAAAIEGGLKTLGFMQDLYGSESIEQIEAYFLLAKANQCLNKFKKAEEFLSIAQWTVIKNPECPAHIRAELHQNFGLLKVARAKYNEAIDHLSKSTYYLSLLNGTDHLITSFGYFNLANVFATIDKHECTNDFLKLVIEIWFKNLIEAFDKPTNEESNENEEALAIDKLDEDKIQEAGRMFEQILTIQMRRYGENHLETGRIFLVCGLYQWYIGEIQKSREYVDKSVEILKYVLGDNHQQTREAQSIFQRLNEQ